MNKLTGVKSAPKHNPKTFQTKSSPTPHDKLRENYQYTPTFVTTELEEMLDELRAQTDITSKSQLFESRPYSYSKFNSWKMKYDTNTRIPELIKKIEEIIESRLVQRGLAGKAIPMTIFLLKNYYGYTDQYQHKVDETVTFKVTRGRPPIEAQITTHNTTPINHLKHK